MPTIEINKPIRLIELFAGYGSQAMALERLGVDFEPYLAVDFDKYAIDSYNALHHTNFPTIDVTKLHGAELHIEEKENYTYILTYSFPCTSLSLAGRMQGMVEGSGTQSSLLWEVQRILEQTPELPDVLLMENVALVHSEENLPHFRRWLNYLESKGYTTFYKDLNAKDFGVGQNRERCFVVSILGEFNYKFPKQINLGKVMSDYIEKNVSEEYYIRSKKAQDLIDKLTNEESLNG